jgi:transposase
MSPQDPTVTASDTEVRPVAKYRTFKAEEKLGILTEYENATNPLERAAILRKAGVYTSHIYNWRQARDGGKTLASAPGRPRDPQTAELLRLRSENDRLQKELTKAQQIIDVQGKVSALLRMFADENVSMTGL